MDGLGGAVTAGDDPRRTKDDTHHLASSRPTLGLFSGTKLVERTHHAQRTTTQNVGVDHGRANI